MVRKQCQFETMIFGSFASVFGNTYRRESFKVSKGMGLVLAKDVGVQKDAVKASRLYHLIFIYIYIYFTHVEDGYQTKTMCVYVYPYVYSIYSIYIYINIV